MGHIQLSILKHPAALPRVVGCVLLNDLSVPHDSYYRPPVKFKCLDGFLGIGPRCVPLTEVGDIHALTLEVRINGELRQRIAFAHLVRSATQLLADVSEFMTLQPGDILMLGCDIGRPLAQAGDRIDIHAPGLPAFGTLSNTLLQPPSPVAPAGVSA
jgi:5-oxopent-3-ene-1,2,5-tricarboxylate decarboxylase/2-hydroxyhepta-2,4-diene-1,7-dioate isomerase